MGRIRGIIMKTRMITVMKVIREERILIMTMEGNIEKGNEMENAMKKEKAKENDKERRGIRVLIREMIRRMRKEEG